MTYKMWWKWIKSCFSSSKDKIIGLMRDGSYLRCMEGNWTLYDAANQRGKVIPRQLYNELADDGYLRLTCPDRWYLTKKWIGGP